MHIHICLSHLKHLTLTHKTKDEGKTLCILCTLKQMAPYRKCTQRYPARMYYMHAAWLQRALKSVAAFLRGCCDGGLVVWLAPTHLCTGRQMHSYIRPYIMLPYPIQ